MSKPNRRRFLLGLLVGTALSSPAAAIQINNWGATNPILPTPPTVPVVTPQYFASSDDPSLSGNNTVATPYATGTLAYFGAHQLVAQPPEPTTLFGSGYTGKMTLQLDIPDRMRVPAGTKLRITAGAGNIDPGKGWFSHVDFYAVGDLDATGTALGASAVPGGPGSTKVTSTAQVKSSRTVEAGTFFSCGYPCDLDNTNAPAQDRYVVLYAVGIPTNGYARRTKPIVILLEGTARQAPLGSSLSTSAVDTYVDPINGSDLATGASAGSATNPYKTVGFGLTKCSAYPAGSVYVKSTSSSPAPLDYVYGDASVGAKGSQGAGWDHKVIRPWGTGLLYLKRSRFGSLDNLYNVPGAGAYQPHSTHQFPFNKVIIQNASIDMANIGAFGTKPLNNSYHGKSMGFMNVTFTNAQDNYDHTWTGALVDSFVDQTLSATAGGDYQAFVVNCSGRVPACAGLTLVAGGHFVLSGDAGYIYQNISSWAEFDFQTRQISLMLGQAAGGYLPVASNAYDPVGQRRVIGIGPEPFTGACKITVASGVATVVCYSDDTLTTPVVPSNLLWQGNNGSSTASAPQVTFAADGSGNPLAGGTFTLNTFVSSAALAGATFTVPCPGVANGSSTVPCHFSINSLCTLAQLANGTANQFGNGEARFATVSNGTAKTAFADYDGGIAANDPASSTPDYACAYNSPSAAMQFVSVSVGRGKAAAGFPLPTNQGAIIAGLPTATLSGKVLTFAGAKAAIGGNQLKTQTVAKGKVVVLQKALPVGMPNMIFSNRTGMSGWHVGDYFQVQKGTPYSGGDYAVGQVTQVDNGTASGVGSPTKIKLINPGQYVSTPSNPAWGVTYINTAQYPSPSGSTTPTGAFAVTCSAAGYPTNTFVTPNAWGTTIWVGSRAIGRTARIGNNTGTASADGTPAYSFYLEGWDGGADVTTLSDWAISYDLHGLSINDCLQFNDGADPSNTFWDVQSVSGNVVTLTAAPSLSTNSNLTVTGYPSNVAKQIVLLERNCDDYGAPLTAKKSDGLAIGDLMRVSSGTIHVDRVQIAEPGHAFKKHENILKSCVRQWGNDFQAFQMDKLTNFAVGSMTVGGSDGMDVSFALPTLPVSSVPSATPSTVWIDGKQYNAYTFTSNASGVTGAALFNWSQYPPFGASAGQTNYIDVRRVIRIKVLSGSLQGSVFRIYAMTYSGMIATITILDDLSNPVLGGSLTTGKVTTIQHPLPIDDGMVISACGSTGGQQGRVFTNNPANPGTGRIHRPFLGSLAGSVTMSPLTGAPYWWVANQVKDMVFLASYCGAGVAGQTFKIPVPAGGMAPTSAWDNVGWVQSTENVSDLGASTVVKPTQLKGGVFCHVGVIDSIHAGFETPNLSPAVPSTGGSIDLAEALFANSNFNALQQNVSDPATQTISLGALASPCTQDASGSPTLVDAENFYPTTNLGSIPRIAAGKLQFPWSCLGEPINDNGLAMIGCRQVQT